MLIKHLCNTITSNQFLVSLVETFAKTLIKLGSLLFEQFKPQIWVIRTLLYIDAHIFVGGFSSTLRWSWRYQVHVITTQANKGGRSHRKYFKSLLTNTASNSTQVSEENEYIASCTLNCLYDRTCKNSCVNLKYQYSQDPNCKGGDGGEGRR